MENTLSHHGIKGMKWGVRRYQNENGSLTPAGKKRYERDVQENNAKKKENRIIIDGPDARRWVKEDISRTKDIVDATSKVTKDVGKLATMRKSKKEELDLSNMTDKELRDSVNRAYLEKQYTDLYATDINPKAAKGKERLMTTLEVAGAILTVGSTALSIALSIRALKGE